MRSETWRQRVDRILEHNGLPECAGCGRRFEPTRQAPKHCRRSCVAAEAERKQHRGPLLGGLDVEG